MPKMNGSNILMAPVKFKFLHHFRQKTINEKIMMYHDNPRTVPLSGLTAGAGVAGEGGGPGRSVGGQRLARRTFWGRQPLL